MTRPLLAWCPSRTPGTRLLTPVRLLPARMAKVTILGDPILDPYGVNRVTILLANYLGTRHEVRVVAPRIAERVRGRFLASRVALEDLEERLWSTSPSTAFGEAWMREALFHTNRRAMRKRSPGTDELVINLSNTVAAPSDIWYLQGPVGCAISVTLRHMVNGLGNVVALGNPVLELLDHHQIRLSHGESSWHIANSRYCRSSYSPFGISVEQVIYPPLETEVFHPATGNPSEDYCVVYLGKETDPRILTKIAHQGVRLKAFGTKLDPGMGGLDRNPNIEILGHLGDQDLSRLYSHAKMTIFPFTIEPFGYVPVESMACGTPVLTYDRQGPAESTLEGSTGWKCRDDAEMIRRAVEIWKGPAIPQEMRRTCVQSTTGYSVESIGQQWEQALAHLPRSVPPDL